MMNICDYVWPKLKILRTARTFPSSDMIKLTLLIVERQWWWENFKGSSWEIYLIFFSLLRYSKLECCGVFGLVYWNELFKENDVSKIIIDLDSSLIISWVIGKMKPPWNLWHKIESILNMFYFWRFSRVKLL